MSEHQKPAPVTCILFSLISGEKSHNGAKNSTVAECGSIFRLLLHVQVKKTAFSRFSWNQETFIDFYSDIEVDKYLIMDSPSK